jgi:hypothetical protein
MGGAGADRSRGRSAGAARLLQRARPPASRPHAAGCALATPPFSPRQSVKDLPILQDSPPPGGFPAIRIERRLPSTGPTGVTIFAVGAVVSAYGYYKARRRAARRGVAVCVCVCACACACASAVESPEDDARPRLRFAGIGRQCIGRRVRHPSLGPPSLPRAPPQIYNHIQQRK